MTRGVSAWSVIGFARPFYRAILKNYVRLILGRHSGLRVENINGTQLVVLPGVFNGVLLRSGALLATTLDESWITRGAKVLDLGTGTGINAIFAARLGANVVATDINPEAVRCANINALVCHLESRIETRLGDLFTPVAGDRFDLILFNPPFYRGRPRNIADSAWRSPDAFDRFLKELPAHLKVNGRALIVLSSDGQIIDALNTAGGVTTRVVRVHDFVNETMTVYEIRKHKE